jgi:Fe-S-cluster containining protein
VSQELIVGLNKETIGTSVLVLMNAIVSKAHNSKLFEHLPMACPTFPFIDERKKKGKGICVLHFLWTRLFLFFFFL